jgi:hypothetical protein
MGFRILSLDGGGTWALLEAMALEDLYPGYSGHQVLSNFDLAVANSGGSIVLAGLSLNIAPSQIRTFFEDQTKRESIFCEKPPFQVALSHRVPLFPRYVAGDKRAGLARALGTPAESWLCDLPALAEWPTGPCGSPVRILIVAFDYDRLREDFLRSYAIPASGAKAEQISLVDAVNASTNAPVTFFDAPVSIGLKRYWDGAMGGYNNPLMAGVVDAGCLGIELNNIEVLSLGTGTVRLVPPDLMADRNTPDLLMPDPRPGILADAGRAGGCITDDPPDAATYTAHTVLGNPPNRVGRVVRMNPVVQPIKEGAGWTYPPGLSQATFAKLTQITMDAVKSSDVNLIKELGVAWIHRGAPNQPIRMLDDLTNALGDPTYPKAKERWYTITGKAA